MYACLFKKKKGNEKEGRKKDTGKKKMCVLYKMKEMQNELACTY